ncbi:MAG TPA: HAD-IA family hydrolase [Puia sp.]|nr:HAD-IA family hydrolase [Puia sp.]
MIRMIVFDMAGTTVNEDNVVYKTLQQSINKKGYDFSLDQVLAEGAGKEKLEAIKSILKVYALNNNNTLADEIYQDFIDLLSEAYEKILVIPQPHALELFKVLKERNIKVVLNTGYNAETAELLIEKLGWKKGMEFDSLISSSDVENNRPDPEMIDLAMDIYGIQDALDVIKVGDSIIDIEEGQNAGCGLNIGITTGAHTYLQLQTANPDFIISDLLDLIPIIDKVNSKKLVH